MDEAPLPPLSLTYLAAFLEREGIEVRIVDFLVTPYRPAKLRRELADFRPQLVGATCVTLNYPCAARMLKACKDFDRNIVTVIGGPHVTFTAEETLLRSPWIDVVVIGEGENTLLDLAMAVDGGEDIRQVAGIAFADGRAVVRSEARRPIADLDQLPTPARHLLPLSKYRALGMPCTVITGRGCPYQCIFCSGRRMFGPGIRYRSPGLVVDEIEKVHRDFGFPQVNIVDDTFTLNHRHASEVCEEMLRRRLNVSWAAFARVDTVTPDLAELMKRAGCVWVLFGVESGDEGILKTIRKGTTRDKVRAGVKTVREAGIMAFNSFILGLPGESPETVRTSMSFAQELDRDFGAAYGFHVLSPLPGTQLYEKADEYGIRILSRNLSHYDANHVITETPLMKAGMMKDVVTAYERQMEEASRETRRRADAGDPYYVDMVERNDRKTVVWKLLEREAIERAGRAVPVTSVDLDAAVGQLARLVSGRLGMPVDAVERWLDVMVADGLVRQEVEGNTVRWRWSDCAELQAHAAAPAAVPT